jgi:hypothetical protein
MKINPSVILSTLLTYLVFFTTALFNLPPYSNMIEKPVTAARALISKKIISETAYPGVYWGVPRSEEDKGVITYNPDKTFEGYTFFSSSLNQSAYLINMAGDIVHEWSLSYKNIWPEPKHVASIVPENKRIISRAHLYANGDILAIYTGIGSAPLGYGLAKVDKDSKLIWALNKAVHHDAEVDEDGKIYTMSHELRMESFPGLDLDKAKPPLYEDFLLVISPEGDLIKKISFLDMFKNSPTQSSVLRHLRRISDGGDTPAGDMLHPNSLEIVSKHIAGKAPMLTEGHLLVSFRNTSMLAMIDPQKEIITWSMYLPARYQHDPRFLDDGSVVLFDNKGHTGQEGESRILRINLEDSSILWNYKGTEAEPLYSAFHSSVDPLPNGNVLITESLAGRLLEVTPFYEIVWDYRSPWQFKDNDITKVPALYRARRFTKDQLTFIEPK